MQQSGQECRLVLDVNLVGFTDAEDDVELDNGDHRAAVMHALHGLRAPRCAEHCSRACDP